MGSETSGLTWETSGQLIVVSCRFHTMPCLVPGFAIWSVSEKGLGPGDQFMGWMREAPPDDILFTWWSSESRLT